MPAGAEAPLAILGCPRSTSVDPWQKVGNVRGYLAPNRYVSARPNRPAQLRSEWFAPGSSI